MSYNLNDNVQESFEFTLGGFTYQMKYPTVEETEKVQDVIKEAKKDEDSSKILAQLFSFITSGDENAPNIEVAIRKQNIKVVQNFNEMIKTEFSGS